MPASKVPILPLVLGFSICGVGGALIYFWLKKNEQKDGSEAGSSSKTDKKPVQIKLKSSVVPIVIGRSGATQRDIEDKTGAKIYFKEEGNDQIYCFINGTPEQKENAKKQIEAIVKENAESRTEDMWVPHSACGRIIGRCGERLTEIMNRCNVKIVVDPPLADAGDDSQKRKVTITGLPHQIGLAQSIILEKVKEDAELRQSLDESLARREPRGPPLIAQGVVDVILPQREKLKPAGADGTMEVYVSAIVSPYRFWMQLLGPQAAALDNLVETMTDYYGKEENRELHRILSPQVGQIVAAMFNVDGKWYRAQVQAIKANDYVPCQPVLDLYFVDYGDNCYAGPLEVFELRADFLTLRFQAIECFLANVSPPELGSADGDESNYPEEAIERFEQLVHVARWKKLWSRVVSYRERDGIVRAPSPSESLNPQGDRFVREGSPVPGVELYDNKDGRDINIAEELIRGGFAKPGREQAPFGDLGKSRVLSTDPENKTPNPTSDVSNKGLPNPTSNVSNKGLPNPTSDLSKGLPKPKPSVAVADFVKNEKIMDKVSDKKNDLVTDTKSFIDGISKDAEKAVAEVKKSAEDVKKSADNVVKDAVKSVNDNVEKVSDKLDAASKDAKKAFEQAEKSADKIVEDTVKSVKDHVAKVNDKLDDVNKKIDKNNTKAFIEGIAKDAEKAVEEARKSVDETVASVKDRAAKFGDNGNKNLEKLKKSPPKLNKSQDDSTDSTPSPSKTPQSVVFKSEVDFMPAFGKADKSKKSPQDAKTSANAFLNTERNGTSSNENNGI